nr:ion transporter [bacterium]
MNINLALHQITCARWFTLFITFLIVVNCLLISVELDYPNPLVIRIQEIIVYLFLIEILVRWFGRKNNSEYFSDKWNYFDVFLVALAFVPEDAIKNPELLTSLRILRVFRVFRLIKAFPELQIVSRVLFRSISSLTSVCFLMMIIMYLYSIMGVILFRGKSQVVTGIGNAGDPFGNVLEAMFSMFRVLTGEDWTDLRYDLLVGQSEQGQFLITTFFISFYVIAAFLLINLVVGAVCNNYDTVVQDYHENDNDNEEEAEVVILEKLDEISSRLSQLEKARNLKEG